MDEFHPLYPQIHYGSVEWERIKAWLLVERKELLDKLAHKNTTWEETIYARGRASMIDTMLGFEELAAPNPLGLPR